MLKRLFPLWLCFVAAVLAATVAFYFVLAWWLSDACRYIPLEAIQITQPNGGQNHTNASVHNQQTPNEPNKVAEAPPVSFNQEISADNDAKAAERHGQWEQESWWGKFWCDVKASDAAIAFFTLVLAIVGFFAILSATSVARELERAYVSGGGPWTIFFRRISGFTLTVDNYGKSPATVTDYAVHVCERSDLPKKPTYRKIPTRKIIKPGEKGLPVVTLTFNTMFNEPVVYGRIWYRDIWRKRHYFSFIQTDDAANDSRIRGVHKAYTKWT